MYILFNVFILTHTTHLNNILSHLPTFTFTMQHACFLLYTICLSVPCSTYMYMYIVHQVYIHHTYMNPCNILYVCCLSVIHHVLCNLYLCGHCCNIIKMAPWYKCFACVHSEALLCTTSAISMVTTAVVAVALKMKPKLKEVSTTIGYQAV